MTFHSFSILQRYFISSNPTKVIFHPNSFSTKMIKMLYLLWSIKRYINFLIFRVGMFQKWHSKVSNSHLNILLWKLGNKQKGSFWYHLCIKTRNDSILICFHKLLELLLVLDFKKFVTQIILLQYLMSFY